MIPLTILNATLFKLLAKATWKFVLKANLHYFFQSTASHQPNFCRRHVKTTQSQNKRKPRAFIFFYQIKPICKCCVPREDVCTLLCVLYPLSVSDQDLGINCILYERDKCLLPRDKEKCLILSTHIPLKCQTISVVCIRQDFGNSFIWTYWLVSLTNILAFSFNRNMSVQLGLAKKQIIRNKKLNLDHRDV